MTEDEKRERIETLLLALKDWCYGSEVFLDKWHTELRDLVKDEQYIESRNHWTNMTSKVESAIWLLRGPIAERLIAYSDPSKYSDEVQRRADNQRKP